MMDCNFAQKDFPLRTKEHNKLLESNQDWERRIGSKRIETIYPIPQNTKNWKVEEVLDRFIIVKRRLRKNIKETQKQKDFYEKAGIHWKSRIFKTENETFKKVLSWME